MCMIGTVDSSNGWVRGGPVMRTARKTHRCDECSRDINPGERYECASGLMDTEGNVYSYTCKTCAHCLAARTWLYMVCRGALYEGVLEDLIEHWDEGPPYRTMTLGRLIVGMRRHWRTRCGNQMPVPDPEHYKFSPELAPSSVYACRSRAS